MLFSLPTLARTSVAAAAAALALGVLAGASSAGAPLAGVRLAECLKGSEPDQRSVQFRGAMRQIPASQTMWMRFRLLERVGDAEFESVRAPGLGVWRKSRPDVRRFVHRQEVLELAESADYRARVKFRWYDAEGELVKRVTRRSGVCRQGGELPNLVVRRIRIAQVGGSPAIHRYELRIANVGGAASELTEISLAVDGVGVDKVPIGPLEPGERRPIYVTGPACVRSVRAKADPSDSVIESSEYDNVLRAPCSPRP